MRDEISAAVLFLARLIEKSENFNKEQLQDFKDRLSELLLERFENHWFPEKPDKGQGYRCIRVNGVNRRDPTLEKAAIACGIKYEDMKLPFELTVWVDPNEVCCRFGESKGSFCTLASFCDKDSVDGSSGSEESNEEALKGGRPSPISTPIKQSLQVTVREKPGGPLARYRGNRASEAVKLGNGRGRRGYYQYHHHHHQNNTTHQQQQQQPWYSLISPPWMNTTNSIMSNSNNNNNNNNTNNNINYNNSNNTSATSSTVTSTTTTASLAATLNGTITGQQQLTTQYHYNSNIRNRWSSATTTATSTASSATVAAASMHHNNYHNYHHNRYDTSTSHKSAVKV